MMSRKQLDKFVRLLKASPSGAVFNPWWQIDEENDIGPQSAATRRKHLTVYFRERLGTAGLAIIGEAIGYRGGHFSGIAMTSERMLLGRQSAVVAALSERRNLQHRASDGGHKPPLPIFLSIKPRSTRQPEISPEGFFATRATDCLGA